MPRSRVPLEAHVTICGLTSQDAALEGRSTVFDPGKQLQNSPSHLCLAVRQLLNASELD